MRIETIEVEVLRQGRPYTNDKARARVVLEDGDDWPAVEAEVRDRLTRGIMDHWLRVEEEERAREAAERKARTEADRARVAARDVRARTRLDEGVAPSEICHTCPDEFWDAGDGCGECPVLDRRFRKEEAA